MKILVAIKRVIDHNVRIRLRADGAGVVTDGVKMSVNPFDEIAVEEALRLRERGSCDEIVVATIGPAACRQQLQSALAMGADRALHVETDMTVEPLDAARVLLALVEREQPVLVLLGKQSIDGDNGQTGQMLAALWDRPQATFASRIDLDGDNAVVAREVDTGIEVLEVALPAVVTTDLRLNEPRFVKLPDILKAKKKPIESLTPDSLGIDLIERVRTLAVAPPAPRPPGVRVESATALLLELEARGLL